MIANLIVAIWFGTAAHKAGRNPFVWGFGGVALFFVVNTVILAVAAILFGPFSSSNYGAFQVASVMASMVISFAIGNQLLANMKLKNQRESGMSDSISEFDMDPNKYSPWKKYE